uniref:Uncharacterized protein n=1 Tax=Rangifer tarandus platyrhynchus TaxID=3082113 RepID=A0ACB0DXY6_RANTA|nr:unnamed protein product [Rangifer tarandus platyrhynchus]
MKLVTFSSVSASSSPPIHLTYHFHPEPLPLSVPRLGVRLPLPGGDLVSTHRPLRSALSLRGTRLQDFHSGRDTQHSHRHLLNPSPSPAPLTSSSRPCLSATPPTAFSPATRFSTSSSASASHSSQHDFRPSTPLPLEVSAHLPPASPRARSFPPDSRGHPPPRSLGPHFPRSLAAVRAPDPGAGHLLPPPSSPRRPGVLPSGLPHRPASPASAKPSPAALLRPAPGPPRPHFLTRPPGPPPVSPPTASPAPGRPGTRVLGAEGWPECLASAPGAARAGRKAAPAGVAPPTAGAPGPPPAPRRQVRRWGPSPNPHR